jgi:uncharacterized protein YkwD
MAEIRQWAILVALALMLVIPARGQAPDPVTADEQLFVAVNDYRATLGLPALKRDVRLDAAAKERHGLAHYVAIGKRGGDTVRERYGEEFFKEIGRRGGARVRALIQQAQSAEERSE